MTRNLKQTQRQSQSQSLSQRQRQSLSQRQSHTRRQKGGGIFDFFKDKLNINIPIGEKVTGFFSKYNPFTRRKTIAEKVITHVRTGVKKVAVVPKQVIVGVKTGVRSGVKNITLAPQKILNNIPGVAPKRPSGGTRKRKQ
jgi:hypothetical protein